METLSYESRMVIEKAMTFPMGSILGRYSSEEGLPAEVAMSHERELKRFLALCALRPDVHYGMAGPIDKLWHTFLLFTRDYSEFCNRVAGRFIHHVPTSTERRNEDKNGYMAFLKDYQSVYKEDPPVHLWPRYHSIAEGITDCGGCSKCSECGNCGADSFSSIGCSGCTGCNSCATQ